MRGYCGGFTDIEIHTPEQMKKMHTKQLLIELRSSYSWGCEYCWNDEDWDKLRNYRNELKNELATREHIPNKIESKMIRKAKIKKGI